LTEDPFQALDSLHLVLSESGSTLQAERLFVIEDSISDQGGIRAERDERSELREA